MSGMQMNQNDWGRVGRVVLAVVLINLGIAFAGTLGLSLGIIGLFPLFFGLTGWRPLSALLKRASVKGSQRTVPFNLNKSAQEN